jgi:hypothetical protein
MTLITVVCAKQARLAAERPVAAVTRNGGRFRDPRPRLVLCKVKGIVLCNLNRFTL